MANKIEVLAPCGTKDSFYGAVNAGCDACYLAGNLFGARAYAGNFDRETLLHAIDYAHLHGVRVYLTVNTLLKNPEIAALQEYLLPYYRQGLDAVIVQDFGVLSYVREHFPDLPIHCSTQMNICSASGAAYAKSCGASRVVTAREMSLPEIESLKKQVDIEVETFVHGAMCYCYSGRCLLSSMAGGRSGNRGRCAQPCRKMYDGTYKMSMKDMCSLQHVPKLIQAGIDSLKIEGRMKNEYYVAACVDAYKTMAEDFYQGCFSEEKAERYQKRLENIFNRGGFTEGYFFQKNGKNMIDETMPGNRGVPVGRVKRIQNGMVEFVAEEDIFSQDVFAIPMGGDDSISFTAGSSAKRGTLVKLKAKRTREIKQSSVIYRMKCDQLLEDIRKNLLEQKKKQPISLEITLKKGEPVLLRAKTECLGKAIEAECKGVLVEAAGQRPLEEQEIKDKLSRLGNTEFTMRSCIVQKDQDIFIPVSALNQLRREVLEQLEQACQAAFHRESFTKSTSNIKETLRFAAYNDFNSKYMTVSVRQMDQLGAVLACRKQGKADSLKTVILEYTGFSKQEWKKALADLHAVGLRCTVALPYIQRDLVWQKETELWQAVRAADGVLVRCIDGLALLLSEQKKEPFLSGKEVILAASLYGYNNAAICYLQESLQDMTERLVFDTPRELNKKELEQLRYPINGVAETCVYGREVLMVTAQCMTKTLRNTCLRESAEERGRWHWISDDRGNRFLTYSDCRCCYNLVYNGMPLSLHGALGEMGRIRLDFTSEVPEEVKRLLTDFSAAYEEGREFVPDYAYTTGHFNRGIE